VTILNCRFMLMSILHSTTVELIPCQSNNMLTGQAVQTFKSAVCQIVLKCI
jgi:hypothetical protein